MDNIDARHDHRGMARKSPRTRPLYIGPWISRLGRKPTEIAKAVDIGESYLSLLISGDKDNPSAALLLAISEELGITINDLYRRPPERELTQRVSELRPDQLAALGDLLDTIKGPRRK